jgi:ATP-dependent protease ClpP protease subunit
MKITPFLNVKKKDQVANIEIFGDIGYNAWADNFDDYQKNTSEVKAREIKALQELDVEVINLTMESLGGDVGHALAIYSLLKNSGATINTYYRGANASASTIIGSAATSVDHIYMDNTGLFLVHKVMSYAEGNENDLQKTMDQMSKWQIALGKAYLNLGVEQVVIDDLIERNGGHGEWLTFEEAKMYGFVGREWKTEKVENYSKDVFINKGILVPNNFNNQNQVKMQKTKVQVSTEEKTLLKKIWNKLSNEEHVPLEEEVMVDPLVTPEEVTDLDSRVVSLEESMADMMTRLAALEEAIASMMPMEDAPAEVSPSIEEEQISNLIERKIKLAIKNLVEPTATKKVVRKNANTEVWEKHLSNFQNFIK